MQVGNRGDIIPLELCEVLKGQIVKKQLDPNMTAQFVEFSTKVPAERLRSIEQAHGVSVSYSVISLPIIS